MPRSSTKSLPWVVLWVGGTREAGNFAGLLMFPHQYWFRTAVILSVDQWFNACTVVRIGDLRVSSRTGLLFDPNQSFLFLSNQQLLNFLFCFSFSEANCQATLSSFSKFSFGEISVWTMTEVWLLLVPLKTTFLAKISARWFPLASRESSLECSRISIIAKAAGIAFNNFWTDGAIFNLISTGRREAMLLPQQPQIMVYSESIPTININMGSFVLG